MIHCWKDYHEWLEEICDEKAGDCDDVPNKTCLLKSGHRGPHKWTLDDAVMVQFKRGNGRQPVFRDGGH